MNRTTAVISGLLALVSGGGVAISQTIGAPLQDATSAAESPAAAVGRGASAWAENCGSCHNLRSPQELGDASWGVAAAHMRVRANLSGDVVRDILAFLQASNGGPPGLAPAPVPAASPSPVPLAASAVPASAPAASAASADIAAGGRTYATTCVACHGANGKGTIPGVPDFTAANGRLTKSDADLLRNMINGLQSPGSPIPMPAKGGNPSLSDQDMANALAYIRKTYGR